MSCMWHKHVYAYAKLETDEKTDGPTERQKDRQRYLQTVQGQQRDGIKIRARGQTDIPAVCPGTATRRDQDTAANAQFHRERPRWGSLRKRQHIKSLRTACDSVIVFENNSVFFLHTILSFLAHDSAVESFCGKGNGSSLSELARSCLF
jgi:hypothetical protein